MTKPTSVYTAEQLDALDALEALGDLQACAIHDMPGDWFAVTGVMIVEGDTLDTVRIPRALLLQAAEMLIEFGQLPGGGIQEES